MGNVERDPADFIIGQRIRRIREQRGWSQEALADRAAVSRSHITQIERGRKAISLPRLRLIANALDVTVSEILENDAISSRMRELREEKELYERARQNLDEISGRRLKVTEAGGTNVPLPDRESRRQDHLQVVPDIRSAEMVKEGVLVSIPVIGRVPADTTRWAEWEHEDRSVSVPAEWLGMRSPEAFFILEVSGDCLAARHIVTGTKVLCRRLNGEPPQNGEIVVARIADEYTLKVWSVEGGRTCLRDGDGNLIVELNAQIDVEAIGVVVQYWGSP